MAGDVFDFEQFVYPKGFFWVQGYSVEGDAKNNGLFLTDGLKFHRLALTRTPVDMKTIYPLRNHPGLYMRFANLNPDDKEGAKHFACEYGLLGLALPIELIDEYEVQERESIYDVRGERLESWQNAIRRMKRAVHLQKVIKDEDSDEIAKLFTSGKDTKKEKLKFWKYDTHPQDSPRTPNPLRVVEWIALEDGVVTSKDAFTAARELLRRWVNAAIEKTSSPKLVYDAHEKRHAIRITPQNLLGCLWLQFALDISGTVSPRQCKECGLWFRGMEGKDRRRGRREYCSDSCKVSYSRRREHRALELKAQKKTLTQIVKQLENEGLTTPAETVKGWLTKPENK